MIISISKIDDMVGVLSLVIESRDDRNSEREIVSLKRAVDALSDYIKYKNETRQTHIMGDV